MTDAIGKAVLSELVNNWARSVRIPDLVTDVGPAVSFGDTLEVPSQAKPTDTSATTRAAPESLTPTIRTVSVDQDVFYNVNLPKKEASQYLNGRWPTATATAMAGHLNNDLDDNIVDHMHLTLAYDTSATYHINPAAASLTDNMVAEAEAALLDGSGKRKSALFWLMSSYGLASIRTISDYVPVFKQEDRGQLGIAVITTLNGIPVYHCPGVNRGRTIAATASAIATNVWTLTVAAGHGAVPGEKLVTAGGTADITTAAAITSVTATTIVLTSAESDDASNGALTITMQSSPNLLVDGDRYYAGVQQMPDVETVKDFESAAKGLQGYTCFGRNGQVGAVRVVHSPLSST